MAESFEQYTEVTKWRVPPDEEAYVAHVYLSLSGECPNGEREHFCLCVPGRIDEMEIRANNIHGLADIGKIGEVKIQNAVRSIVSFLGKTLGNGCLVHPAVRAYKNYDGSWGISPWAAKKINKPWEQMAIKKDTWGYWIPVKNIWVYDPQKEQEVPIA